MMVDTEYRPFKQAKSPFNAIGMDITFSYVFLQGMVNYFVPRRVEQLSRGVRHRHRRPGQRRHQVGQQSPARRYVLLQPQSQDDIGRRLRPEAEQPAESVRWVSRWRPGAGQGVLLRRDRAELSACSLRRDIPAAGDRRRGARLHQGARRRETRHEQSDGIVRP